MNKEDKEELARIHNMLQQRRKMIVMRVNQLDAERSQLIQEAIQIDGKLDLIQQLTGGNDEKVVEFPSQETNNPEDTSEG